MMTERPAVARMTLRQLLVGAGKLTREIALHAQGPHQTRLADLINLSRPTRKKTQFPAMVALQNGLGRFDSSSREILDLMSSLDEHLQAINELAHRAVQERQGDR